MEQHLISGRTRMLRLRVRALEPGPIVHYDRVQKRLWLAGQRCHHGAAGAVVAVAGATLLGTTSRYRTLLPVVAMGCLSMAHDWDDRAIWFQPGWGTQPAADAKRAALCLPRRSCIRQLWG